MKRFLMSLGIIAIAAIIGLVMTACPSELDPDPEQPDTTILLNNDTFAGKISEIRNKPGTYVIKLTGDISDYAGVALGQ